MVLPTPATPITTTVSSVANAKTMNAKTKARSTGRKKTDRKIPTPRTVFCTSRASANAVQTATMIVAVGAGLVAVLPDSQPMRTFVEPSGATTEENPY